VALADLLRGAVREQAHAVAAGEKRSVLEHVLIVVGVTGLSWFISRVTFGFVPIKPVSVLVLAPQYIGLVALGRAIFATTTRVGRGIRMGGAELMVWSVVAVMCGVVLQAPWQTPFSSHWVLGQVRFGFGAGLNQIAVFYFVLAVWPARRRSGARWGSFA
jgi:hypothetical protein